MEYTFSLTMNPSFGIIASDEHFVHVERRIGQVNGFIKKATIKHIDFLDNLKKENKLKGYLQLRRLFYNDKSGTFECVVDYLTDILNEAIPAFSIRSEQWIIEGQPTYVDFKIIRCSFVSDHFDKNHKDYYASVRVIPWINDFDNYILLRGLDDIKKNK